MADLRLRDPVSGVIVSIPDDENAEAEIAKRGLQLPRETEVQVYDDQQTSAPLGLLEKGIRGATLGQVGGFGTREEQQARQRNVDRNYPISGVAAEFVPDVAAALVTGGVSALATGAGRVAAKQALKGGARAALKVGAKAAPRAALAGEALGGGATAAAEQSFKEGRTFLHEDVGEDMKNVALYGGLGLALGAAPSLLKRAGKGKKGAKKAAEQLDDVAATAERKAAPEVAEDAAKDQAEGVMAHAERRASQSEADDIVRRSASGTVDEAPSLGRSAALSRNSESIKDTIISEQRTSLNSLRKGMDDIWDHEMRNEDVIRNVGSNHTAQIYQAREFAIKARGLVGELRADAKRTGGALSGTSDAATAKLSKAKASGKGTRTQHQVATKDLKTKIALQESKDSAAIKAIEQKNARRVTEHRKAVADAGTDSSKRAARRTRDRTEAEGRAALKSAKASAKRNAKKARNETEALSRKQGVGADKARQGIADSEAALSSGGEVYTPGVAQLIADIELHTSKMMNAKDGPSAFNMVDGLKRMMQKHKLSFESGAKQSNSSVGHHAVIQRLEPVQNVIRLGAEMEDVWGKMGAFQKARNSIATDKLIPINKAFNESFGKVLGRDYNSNLVIDAVEEKLDSLVNSRKGRSSSRRYMADMLDAVDEMADVDSLYSVRGKGSVGMKKNTANIRRGFELADEVNAAKSRFEVVDKVPVVGGLVKDAFAGDLTASFRRLADSKDAAATRTVDDWFRTSRARAKGGETAEKGSGVMSRAAMAAKRFKPNPTLARRGYTRTMQEFIGEDSSPRAAYQRTVTQLQDDEGFLDNVADQFNDVAQVSPQGMALLAGHAMESRQFLLSKMPASIAVSMSRPGGYPPSEDAIADWAVYVNAVRDPMAILDRIGSGDIRPQEIEVLKTLSATKGVYESVQMELLDRLSRQSVSEPLDDNMVMRLSMLFDLDGAGTPAFSRRAAETAMSAQPPPNQPQGKAKPVQAGSRVDPNTIGQSGATYGTQG